MSAPLNADIKELESRNRLEELLEFRKSHPQQQITIDGREWHYLVTPRKEKSLLILPGAIGSGEQPFHHITALEKQFCIISPNYPPVSRMGDLLSGLVQLVEKEGFAQTHIYGGSYGGIVAQCFVRSYPEIVDKLIISHTAIPRKKKLRQIKLFGLLLRLIPMFIVKSLYSKKITKMVADFPVEAEFWERYLIELIHNLRKVDLISSLNRVIDLMINYDWTPDDLKHWKGQMLVIQSNDDPMVPEEMRRMIRDLYPAARHQSFEGTGHASSLLKPEEFQKTLLDFLLEL